MPYIDIRTNSAPADASAQTSLLQAVSADCARLLGKPESLLMIRFEVDGGMLFGGTNEPCCFVDIRLIGMPSGDVRDALNAALCAHLDRRVGVKPARTFVVFTDVPREHWGVRGSMLA